jgi:hypothetical protein
MMFLLLYIRSLKQHNQWGPENSTRVRQTCLRRWTVHYDGGPSYVLVPFPRDATVTKPHTRKPTYKETHQGSMRLHQCQKPLSYFLADVKWMPKTQFVVRCYVGCCWPTYRVIRISCDSRTLSCLFPGLSFSVP